MNEVSFSRARTEKLHRVRSALNSLRDARLYAQRTGSDVWDFAVEINELKVHGLTTNDLRWLVSVNAIEHARDISQSSDQKRVFERCNNLSFGEDACFILTTRGLEIMSSEGFDERDDDRKDLGSAASSKGQNGQPYNGHSGQSNNGQPNNHLGENENGHTDSVPTWNSAKRELMFMGQVIKRFKWPAPNQELVVKAFQEEGWPDLICDPLPPHDHVNPKTRLHDTIKCLNRGQLAELIRFHGNGDGKGVRWRRVTKS
jgi:hypothetical protein